MGDTEVSLVRYGFAPENSLLREIEGKGICKESG